MSLDKWEEMKFNLQGKELALGRIRDIRREEGHGCRKWVDITKGAYRIFLLMASTFH
jgi:hypothetical protein